MAKATMMVGDDEESKYEECAFVFFSPMEMPGEPANLKEAVASSDAEEWKKAMESELKSIEENSTWELVELPEGRKAITSKWLFKIKCNADGKIECYKSRLVAKGYQQKEKVDFKELFALVMKPTTLRTLLAGAAIKGWVVKQVDVTTAFLNGVLEEEIFLAQPEGFDDCSGRVLKLKKALYGLKQAPRQWYLKLRDVLEEVGFTPLTADHSLFMLGEGEQRRFLVVYVDDIFIFSPSSDLVKEVMLKLQDKFKCKALGDVNFYLELHIERDVEKWCMWVHQRKYLEALAANFGKSESHVATPFPSGFKCVKGSEEESVGEEERHRFHSLVGSLMVVRCPYEEQVAAGMRLARYLGQTPTVGLQYSAAAQRRQKGADGVEPVHLFLTAFLDASYASEPEDMTSFGGFICCVGGGPTAQESKKQVDQALSSVESEYMALFRAVREIVWQRRLLAELGEDQQGPTPLYYDSQGIIALAKNPVLHGLTKHMRVKWHWTRSMVAAGEVELHYEKTTMHPADMMTKRPVKQQHRKFYGLCQSPCEWHDTLRTTLAVLRLADPSLFVRFGLTPFFLLVYVDDLVFATADRAALAEVLQRFRRQFSTTQPTPLAVDHRLSGPFLDDPFESSGPYAELVGCLIYLMTCTHPDPTFPLSVLSRFVATGRHRPVHWTTAIRVAKYLATTSGMGLVLGGTQLVVVTSHCDSSYADDVKTQQSTQGYCFSLGAGAVSWRSTRSSTVALSSAETNIYAGAMAVQQVRCVVSGRALH
ncbi:unnamed protein product [Closterium sp. NIES-54]